jgi:hypothetical protein
MSAVRIVVLLWGGLYFALGLVQAPGDGDLWWQRWLGDLILRTHHLPSSLGSETFTAAGAPWVPQEWVLSVLVAFAMNHHAFILVRALVSVVPAAILILIYLRSRDRAAPEAIAAVLLLCGMAFKESFGIRAQVLGWACFAAFLFALDRRDRWFYATIPIVIVWANLHASVMVAPVIVVARIAGAALDDGVATLRTNRDLRILPALLVGVLCTPFGWHLPAFALAFASSPIRRYIVEWRPVRIDDLSFWFAGVPITALVLLNPRQLLRQKSESLPIAILFIAMISAGRNIPLYAIAAAPLAARNLGAALPRLAVVGRKLQEMEPVALVAIAIALVVAPLALARNQQNEPPMLPNALISELGSSHSDHRVFCENFTWCSIALQFPSLQVYMDGRCDAYPLDVWKSYITAAEVKPSWQHALGEYDVDAVVANRYGPLAKDLAAIGGWHLSLEDSRYVVFVRT